MSPPPFTQRGDVYFDGIDAVEQILSEFAFRYQFVQVRIGSTNQSDIDVYGFCTPQFGDFPFFDGG